MTFKEWFVGQFNRKARIVQKSEVFTALRGVNLEVRQGERLGIVGPNGAGKTTLLKCIAGIYEPTEGIVTVQGAITPLIEIAAGFNPELSGRENIYLHGAIRGMTRAEIRLREGEIVDFADIDGFIDVPTKYYSSGMMSRLAFSIATAISPEILILDEVFAPGDAGFVKKALERIHEIIDAAHILLFVSHSQGIVRELCTRTIWLDQGSIIADGDPPEVFKYYSAGARLSAAKEFFFLRDVDSSSFSTVPKAYRQAKEDLIGMSFADLRSQGVRKRDCTEKPLLSVIVVVKIRKDLDRCIRSVLIQPYDNIELIVVDTVPEQAAVGEDCLYCEAVDVWQRIGGATTEDAICSGIGAALGSVVHILYSSDALADDTYSLELIRNVRDRMLPHLLDYSIFRSNGTINNSPSLPLFHPVLLRALLVPKSIYDRTGFQSVHKFLALLTSGNGHFCFPSGSARVYLEESPESLLTETVEYWAADMPLPVRKQLANELRECCDSSLLWRISPKNREIILQRVAASFTNYVRSLPDRALQFEKNRSPGLVYFDRRTSSEKPALVIGQEPMKHHFHQIIDRLIGDLKGWSVFIPDCVFRDWSSFFGAKGAVIYGADRSKHITSLEGAYRRYGYAIGEFRRIDPVNYRTTTRFDLVFTALYPAYYLDPQLYFSRMAMLVDRRGYLFIGYWNFNRALQRLINRAINPRFAAVINPDAMDREKIMSKLSNFEVVDEGYCGGVWIFMANEPRDSEQRLILSRLQREVAFVGHALSEPSPEWSVHGYIVARRSKEDIE